MRRLLRLPTPTLRRLAAAALGVGLAVYILAMVPPEKTMVARGSGILGLELAGTASEFTHIVTAWGEVGVEAARTQTGADFAFIASYGLLLTILAELGNRAGHLPRWTRYAVWLGPLAMVTDALENWAMLTGIRVLEYGGVPERSAALATALAGVKFAAIALAVVVLLAHVGAALLNRRTKVPLLP